jgi:hypothetical protein
MRVIQNTLNTVTGEEVKTYQRIEQPEDFSRPWAIVRLLPDLRRYTVARFYNRTDAQDHLRVSTALYLSQNLKSSSTLLQI